MVQSCPEASPVKWHLAHTSWFFETFVLREFVAAYQPFHPDFIWLFNSYYNSLGDMPEKKLRASFSRPPLDSIFAYRAHVDAAIAAFLQHPHRRRSCPPYLSGSRARAAAPRAHRHRHQARPLHQSTPPRLSRSPRSRFSAAPSATPRLGGLLRRSNRNRYHPPTPPI